MQREHVARNVGHLVDPPTGAAADPVWLSSEQLHTVLEHAARDRHHIRWILAIVLGLRQGEALGLCWSDVDWDAGTIHIHPQLTRAPGVGVLMGPLKTASSDRVLALPATVLQLLHEHRRQQLEARLAGRTWSTWRSGERAYDLVVCQDNGRPVDHARDYRNWRALLERAGLPAVPLHAARHTAATTLLTSGVALPVVADFLGHSSTRMTERYAHVASTLNREAAQLLERAVWGQREKAPAVSSR
jgi:integrase